jgi:hypothetical protein
MTSLTDLIYYEEQKYGVPDWIATPLIYSESSFNPSSGAGTEHQGLLQLSSTFPGVTPTTDRLDPQQNLSIGFAALGAEYRAEGSPAQSADAFGKVISHSGWDNTVGIVEPGYLTSYAAYTQGQIAMPTTPVADIPGNVYASSPFDGWSFGSPFGIGPPVITPPVPGNWPIIGGWFQALQGAQSLGDIIQKTVGFVIEHPGQFLIMVIAFVVLLGATAHVVSNGESTRIMVNTAPKAAASASIL